MRVALFSTKYKQQVVQWIIGDRFKYNEIGIVLYQNEAEKTIKRLKVLFKCVFTKNGTTMTILIAIFFL